MARLKASEKKACKRLLDMSRGNVSYNYLEQYYYDRFNALLRLYKSRKEDSHKKMILNLLKDMEKKRPDVSGRLCSECRKKYLACS